MYLLFSKWKLCTFKPDNHCTGKVYNFTTIILTYFYFDIFDSSKTCICTSTHILLHSMFSREIKKVFYTNMICIFSLGAVLTWLVLWCLYYIWIIIGLFLDIIRFRNLVCVSVFVTGLYIGLSALTTRISQLAFLLRDGHS